MKRKDTKSTLILYCNLTKTKHVIKIKPKKGSNDHTLKLILLTLKDKDKD